MPDASPLPAGRPIKMHYEVGDPCWIFVPPLDTGGMPEFVKGRVVATVHPPNLLYEVYVIELQYEGCADFPLHHEVRDATLMSDHPDHLPPFGQMKLDGETAPPDLPKKNLGIN